MASLDRYRPAPDRPWPNALAVVAIVVPLIVVGWHLRYPIEALAMLARSGHWVRPLSAVSSGRALVWLVVGVGILMGWRVVVAIAAGGAVIAEVVLATTADPPMSILAMAWLWLPDIAAALLLAISVATGVGLNRLTPWGRVFLVAAVAVLMLSATIIPMVGGYPQTWDSGFAFAFAIRSDIAALVRGLTVLVTFALMTASVAGLAPPVRRRALVVLSTGAAALVVERFAGPRFGTTSFNALGPRVSAVLAATVMLGSGLAWVVARERPVRGVETSAEGG